MPGFDAACLIAQAANVSLDWLAGADNPGTFGGDDGDGIIIPVANVSASAGNGADMFSGEEFDEHIVYSRTFLRRELGIDAEKRLALIDVAGSSMWPTLLPGDRLLVAEHNGDPVLDSAIYVLRNRHGGVVVKRLYIRAGKIQMRGDNEDKPSGEINPLDEDVEWYIIARALHFERRL